MIKMLVYAFLFSTIVFAQDDAGLTGKEISLTEDLPTESKIEYSPDKEAITISLTTVMEQGLRLNPQERIRSYNRETLELNWDQTFYNFWFPNMQMTLTNEDQSLKRVSSRQSNGQNLSTVTKSPQATLGFDFGSYDIFNWGRDYLLYQNDQNTYKRGVQVLSEQRRKLKFNLIKQYFNVVRFRQLQKIKKEQLRHTSFVYRLAKEKVLLKKISKQDYYQARAEFLRSQTEYQEAQFDVITGHQDMANLLGDSLMTAYKPEETLEFKPIAVPMQDAIEYALSQSPSYRNAKLALDNSERFYEKTLRDNLPLPKISMNLGTYSHTMGREGGMTSYETLPGNSNVELVATVNMTWDLVGGNGLFNNRRNKRSYIDKKIAEINYFNSRRELELKMRMAYQSIKFLENQIQISTVQLDNAHKNFDVILDNYVAGNNNFADLKNAIKTLVDSGVNVENSKYNHLTMKLDLSDSMGLEDFPGERFDDLAKK